jgi:hypothetical protein
MTAPRAAEAGGRSERGWATAIVYLTQDRDAMVF